jgi:hypothetical protein
MHNSSYNWAEPWEIALSTNESCWLPVSSSGIAAEYALALFVDRSGPEKVKQLTDRYAATPQRRSSRLGCPPERLKEVTRMTSWPPDAEEFVLRCKAIIAARRAAGLENRPQSPGDRWWDEGPHIEKDGRCYYVHAMGCLVSHLGDAMLEHPDWYLVTALVRGDTVELHGLGDHAVTLGEIRAMGDNLDPDDMRLAIELTPQEKRRGWGVRN